MNGRHDDRAYVEAMDAALRLLSRWRYTERELAGKLGGKGHSADRIEAVCARLREMGYLDDRRYAADWARSRAGPKRKSAWMVKRELLNKGIDPAVAAEAVGGCYDERTAFSDACALARKKLRGAGGRDRAAVRRLVQNALLRRGFGYDFIGGVLAEVMKEDEHAQ